MTKQHNLRTAYIGVRITQAQLHAWNQLGGRTWLRRLLDQHIEQNL